MWVLPSAIDDRCPDKQEEAAKVEADAPGVGKNKQETAGFKHTVSSSVRASTSLGAGGGAGVAPGMGSLGESN